MYKLIIAQKARKEIKALGLLLQEALLETLQAIRDDPFSGKPLTREFSGQFAYKIGQYRIIYKVDKKDHVIKILTAGHRATVYQ